MNDKTGYDLTTISMVKEPLCTTAITAVNIVPSKLSHQEIRITNDNNETLVAVDFETGTVEFGDKYDIDEATEIFWTSIGQDSPEKLKKEIAELKEKLEIVTSSNQRFADKLFEAKEALKKAMEILD